MDTKFQKKQEKRKRLIEYLKRKEPKGKMNRVIQNEAKYNHRLLLKGLMDPDELELVTGFHLYVDNQDEKYETLLKVFECNVQENDADTVKNTANISLGQLIDIAILHNKIKKIPDFVIIEVNFDYGFLDSNKSGFDSHFHFYDMSVSSQQHIQGKIDRILNVTNNAINSSRDTHFAEFSSLYHLYGKKGFDHLIAEVCEKQEGKIEYIDGGPEELVDNSDINNLQLYHSILKDLTYFNTVSKFDTKKILSEYPVKHDKGLICNMYLDNQIITRENRSQVHYRRIDINQSPQITVNEAIQELNDQNLLNRAPNYVGLIIVDSSGERNFYQHRLRKKYRDEIQAQIDQNRKKLIDQNRKMKDARKSLDALIEDIGKEAVMHMIETSDQMSENSWKTTVED